MCVVCSLPLVGCWLLLTYGCCLVVVCAFVGVVCGLSYYVWSSMVGVCLTLLVVRCGFVVYLLFVVCYVSFLLDVCC